MKKILFISLLLLAACQPGKKNPNEFTLSSFLEKQAQQLSQAGLSKITVINGNEEKGIVKNVNWNNELEMFKQADILKGSLRYRYKFEKPAPNQSVFSASESSERLPVKSFKITYGKDTTEIKSIEIVIRKKNYIYESERTLLMNLDKNSKGDLLIKNYQISGTKKLVFTAPSIFSVKAEVL